MFEARQFFEYMPKAAIEAGLFIASQTRQFIERAGIYIFFVSLFLYSQLHWMKRRNNYTEIEVRLFSAFLIGVVISFGIVKLIEKITYKNNKKDEVLLKNLSVALSPGVLFIFAATNKIFLVGVPLCVFVTLYIWVKSFRKLINAIVYVAKFKNVLSIEENKATLSLQGVYEKSNPKAMQLFLIDLIINLYECLEIKAKEIKIDFTGLNEKNKDELKSIIEPIAKYFNLRIIY